MRVVAVLMTSRAASRDSVVVGAPKVEGGWAGWGPALLRLFWIIQTMRCGCLVCVYTHAWRGPSVTCPARRVAAGVMLSCNRTAADNIHLLPVLIGPNIAALSESTTMLSSSLSLVCSAAVGGGPGLWAWPAFTRD